MNIKYIMFIYGILCTILGLIFKDSQHIIIGNIWMVGSLIKD